MTENKEYHPPLNTVYCLHHRKLEPILNIKSVQQIGLRDRSAVCISGKTECGNNYSVSATQYQVDKWKSSRK